MNPYNRPPGSSRCPHGNYYFKKFNARATGMYCGFCNELAGWWTGKNDNTNYERTISGEVTKLSRKEKELLR